MVYHQQLLYTVGIMARGPGPPQRRGSGRVLEERPGPGRPSERGHPGMPDGALAGTGRAYGG